MYLPQLRGNSQCKLAKKGVVCRRNAKEELHVLVAICQSKEKFTLEQAMKTQSRSRGKVKTRYPMYRKLCGPQGQSGRVLKISPPTGIRSADRPATDWATPAPVKGQDSPELISDYGAQRPNYKAQVHRVRKAWNPI